MRKWIWWMLVWAALPLRAEVLSDADDDKLEAVIQQSLDSRFAGSKSFYSGPRGLLLLDNCEPVRLVDHRSGEFPRETGSPFSVPVKLFFRKDKKTDSIDAKVRVEIEGPGVFHVSSVDFSPDQLSAVDPCEGLRGNSRLLASVRRRELLLGMPEKAVRASWGSPLHRKVLADGVVQLEYDGRTVRLAGGLVQSWSP